MARIAKTSKVPVRARRAIVVMARAAAAGRVDREVDAGVEKRYVRHVIHDFNEQGFDALDPKWSGGRPSKTIEDA